MVASELQESGEHSGLVPTENVATSKPSRNLSFGIITFVSKEGSGKKLCQPASSS